MMTDTNLRARMHTLSAFSRTLLQPSLTIHCPTMRLLVRDREILIEGPGEIRVDENTGARYWMHGTPKDGDAAFRAMVKAQKDPWTHTSQFRLFANDYAGREWACGFTEAAVSEQNGGVWHITGRLGSIMVDVAGFGVSPEPGVELIYAPEPRVPMLTNMRTEVRYGNVFRSETVELGETTFELYGSLIQFWREPVAKQLRVAATTSHLLPHPHLENWLSEPLRMLVGDHVYPRLVARNFGDGQAFVSLRPAPAPRADQLRSSMLGDDPMKWPRRFWDLYGQLLGVIACARQNGHPHFEQHELTGFYHEIAEASAGSNWILCMTLASTVEGLVRLIYRESLPSEFPFADFAALEAHVRAWPGNPALAARLAGFLKSMVKPSPTAHLRHLADLCLVTKSQVKAWQEVRNPVAHGVLVSPWPDEALEGLIDELVSLVHALSRLYVRREWALIPRPLALGE